MSTIPVHPQPSFYATTVVQGEDGSSFDAADAIRMSIQCAIAKDRVLRALLKKRSVKDGSFLNGSDLNPVIFGENAIRGLT